MDEVTAVYNEEIYEKKQLANASRGRKHYNNTSSKNALPSDKLKKKEINELSSDVTVYHLSKPMLWKQFRLMPIEYQEEYLHRLLTTYPISSNDLAKMFKVHGTTVRKYIRHCKFKTVTIDPNNRGNRRPKDLTSWENFLNSDSEYVEAVKILTTPKHSKSRSTEISTTIESDTTMKHSTTSNFSRTLSSLNLEYEGVIDLNQIMKDLEFLSKCNVSGKLSIQFQAS